MANSAKHKELGDFLKTRRMRMSLQEAGLPVDGARRRTPGLRREEVAALSGVSLAWYTYLEQGRLIRVSEQVLSSLARTLKLDRDERDYLFKMAGQRPPDDASPAAAEEDRLPPSLRLVLDGIRDYPAFIADGRFTVVAWNRLASAVFGYRKEEDALERNLIWRLFANPAHQQLFCEWEHLGKLLLAQFRNYYGNYADNPWYVELVEKLKEKSPEFAEWWPRHEVLESLEGFKKMRHPLLGEISLEYNSFAAGDDRNLMMAVFTPRPGTDTADKLKRLIAE
ncbi:helix-turn-helix transcriptional regulator [Cohnella zeiphila]|uniref:Helix-turn-helix domain-containing protein n=1 Tax=Cohnella zeiphila TaxID=2761120 RepID=A0A7X0VXN1_9BACL|nr:helix-turn-helix transcriptional regulator [Cohnella zeiphila]MBB6734181.1 helix-turn-helix domain-containing protein [Cohnella zeiphila]